MDMNWLMLIRVEIEYKTEIFEYLWHNNYYLKAKIQRIIEESK